MSALRQRVTFNPAPVRRGVGCFGSVPQCDRRQPPSRLPAARRAAGSDGETTRQRARFRRNHGDERRDARAGHFTTDTPRERAAQRELSCQKITVILSSGGQIVQTWYTAGSCLDAGASTPISRRRTDRSHVGDSTHQFAAGKLAKADTGINEILAVAFERVFAALREDRGDARRLGIDATQLHESSWRGAVVYVSPARAW